MSSRRRRILWVGKSPTNGMTGDEVYDRKTLAACRAQGCDVHVYYPVPVSRLREAAVLATGVLPYQRTRFATKHNRHAILEQSRKVDAVICSWEPHDALVRRLSPPSILITHNVASRALPALFPNNMLATLAAARAGAWERRWYRSGHFAAIGALSRRDFAYLDGITDRPELLLLPPGMPPCIELRRDAGFTKEIVISGTFGWPPKHRDIMRFAREYAAVVPRLPIRADGLPPEAMTLLQPSGVPLSDDALRIGLITDRFEAGHKLKTLAYVANNQIVLSFAEVGFDFVHIPDHDLFIRKLESVADIAAHVSAIADLPAADLRERFVRFQHACARYFTWDAVARKLLEAADTAIEAGSRNDRRALLQSPLRADTQNEERFSLGGAAHRSLRENSSAGIRAGDRVA